MVLSADGLVLTNDHVVAGGNAVQVTLAGQSQAHTAAVVGEDATHDLAVHQDRCQRAAHGAAGRLIVTQVGDAVIAIGNALGLGGSPAVTRGIVSALNRTVPGGPQLVDADPGCSDRRSHQPGELRWAAGELFRPGHRH